MGHRHKRDTLEEARRFLSIAPSAAIGDARPRNPRSRRPSGTPGAARRLFAVSRPVKGTVAERYLQARGLHAVADLPALRFHPNCFYRPSKDDAPDTRAAWPALIAAVTDTAGTIVGAHRTWIDPVTLGKAPIATPRRAMGHLLGHGVRVGEAGPVMAAGEGIETVLSLRRVLPTMPMIAALSSAHLGALEFPSRLRRLYVARDNDRAGAAAIVRLADRARALDIDIDIIPLTPELVDHNDDLRLLPPDAFASRVARQLLPDEVARFLISEFDF